MPKLRGEQHPLRKLSAEDVLAIRANYVPGLVTLAELGEQYGVSIQTISTIVQNKTWAWLNEADLKPPVWDRVNRELAAIQTQTAIRSLGITPPVLPATADWNASKFQITLRGDAREIYCPFDDGDRNEQLEAVIDLLAGIAIYDQARVRWSDEEDRHRETDAEYLNRALEHHDHKQGDLNND